MFIDINCFTFSQCQENQFLIDVYTIQVTVCSVSLNFSSVFLFCVKMNERSAMVEVNRPVKYRFKDFKSLLTLPNMPVCISDLFIASVKVSILVVLVTAQLKASGIIER